MTSTISSQYSGTLSSQDLLGVNKNEQNQDKDHTISASSSSIQENAYPSVFHKKESEILSLNHKSANKIREIKLAKQPSNSSIFAKIKQSFNRLAENLQKFFHKASNPITHQILEDIYVDLSEKLAQMKGNIIKLQRGQIRDMNRSMKICSEMTDVAQQTLTQLNELKNNPNLNNKEQQKLLNRCINYATQLKGSANQLYGSLFFKKQHRVAPKTETELHIGPTAQPTKIESSDKTQPIPLEDDLVSDESLLESSNKTESNTTILPDKATAESNDEDENISTTQQENSKDHQEINNDKTSPVSCILQEESPVGVVASDSSIGENATTEEIEDQQSIPEGVIDTHTSVENESQSVTDGGTFISANTIADSGSEDKINITSTTTVSEDIPAGVIPEEQSQGSIADNESPNTIVNNDAEPVPEGVIASPTPQSIEMPEVSSQKNIAAYQSLLNRNQSLLEQISSNINLNLSPLVESIRQAMQSQASNILTVANQIMRGSWTHEEVSSAVEQLHRQYNTLAKQLAQPTLFESSAAEEPSKPKAGIFTRLFNKQPIQPTIHSSTQDIKPLFDYYAQEIKNEIDQLEQWNNGID